MTTTTTVAPTLPSDGDDLHWLLTANDACVGGKKKKKKKKHSGNLILVLKGKKKSKKGKKKSKKSKHGVPGFLTKGRAIGRLSTGRSRGYSTESSDSD